MKLILLSLLLLTLSKPAICQRILIPRGPELMPGSQYFANANPWELTETRAQVINRLVSQPGWTIAKEDEPDKNDKEVVTAFYQSVDKRIFLIFSFWRGELYDRAYGYSTSDTEAKQAWDTIIDKLPYDEANSRWVDKREMASITRRYVGNEYVLYKIEMYSEPKEDKAQGLGKPKSPSLILNKKAH